MLFLFYSIEAFIAFYRSFLFNSNEFLIAFN